MPSMEGGRSLEVGGLVARPGGKAHGLVAVEVGDGQVELPIVVVCGTGDGPRVAVTAGIHGGEYVSIPALREVIDALDPADVTGSIVAVLDANPRAFFSRSVYITPPDGKNINRVFPGDPRGSPTERLASWLFQQVIAPSQRFIDMHSGDLNEELVPFVGMTAPIEPSVDSAAEAMANEYGLAYVIGGGMAAGTAVGAARVAHIPAIWSEVGGRGSWSPEEVGMHAAGLRRALKAAGVYRGPTAPAVQVPRHLRQNAWLRSEVSGSLYLDVAVGDMVEDGQSVGEIRDFFGEALQPVRATMSGLVFFVVTSLAIESGDPILGIGA
jgi:predicted deacylase